MGTARWTYNRCLEIINMSIGNEVKKNMKDMRMYVVNNIHYQEENQWVLNTPYMIRDDAARELITAFKGNFIKLRQGIQDIRFNRKTRRILFQYLVEIGYQKVVNFHSSRISNLLNHYLLISNMTPGSSRLNLEDIIYAPQNHLI